MSWQGEATFTPLLLPALFCFLVLVLPQEVGQRLYCGVFLTLMTDTVRIITALKTKATTRRKDQYYEASRM